MLVYCACNLLFVMLYTYNKFIKGIGKLIEKFMLCSKETGG